MTANTVSTPPQADALGRLPLAFGALTLAGCLAVVGGIIGAVMALHGTVTPCPNGHVSYGGDPNCYAHNGAGVGSGLVILCAVLLCVIIAFAILLRTVQARWTPTPDGVPLRELTTS